MQVAPEEEYEHCVLFTNRLASLEGISVVDVDVHQRGRIIFAFFTKLRQISIFIINKALKKKRIWTHASCLPIIWLSWKKFLLLMYISVSRVPLSEMCLQHMAGTEIALVVP
ncbi:hypothetical protein CEXT_621251 [Caerostris extrusa]|uniref:Uncharacterized protein n=1 Tax=Caerostris extrusa TaxID=172846 RepID=A0AAV4WLB3_CAEEX|nr:hypothetical protein CEXT_621251 [Caerostris extrusa]